MNWGGFASGLSTGIRDGMTIGKLIKDGMAEMEQKNALKEAKDKASVELTEEVNSRITEQKPDEAPKSGVITEPKVVTPTNEYENGKPATVSVEAVPDYPNLSPTRNPDTAGAATANSGMRFPQPAQAPEPAPTSAQNKGVLYIAGAPASGATKGLVEMGNIDINARKPVQTPDGKIATVQSFSIGVNGKEVLIPQVVNGKILSQPEAIDHFRKTGEHLGVFDSVESANAYGEVLHKQQEQAYTGEQPAVTGTVAPQSTAAPAPAPTPAPTATTAPTPAPTTATTAVQGMPLVKGRFVVDGKGYETREEAVKAAEKAVGSSTERQAQAMATRMEQHYLDQGDPVKAKAWADYAESVKGKAAIRDGVAVMTAPDLDSALSRAGRYYSKHIDDGVNYKSHEVITKTDGTQVGIVTLLDKKSGKETKMEVTKESILQMIGSANPQKLFEREVARQDEAGKLKLQMKIKEQERRQQNEDNMRRDAEKDDRADKRAGIKADNARSMEEQKQRGRESLETLKKLLGDEGSSKYQKSKSPDERYNIIRTAMEKDALFARKTEEQKDAAVRQQMDAAERAARDYGGDAPAKPAPAAAPAPAASAPAAAPAGKSVVVSDQPMPYDAKLPVVYLKGDKSKPFHVTPNGYVPVKGAIPEAKPAAAPAPAPAVAAPAPAAAGLPQRPAAVPPAAPAAKAAPAPAAPQPAVDPILAQIQKQSDPTIRDMHLAAYKTMQQADKGLAELSKSFAAAAAAGDDVQKNAISEQISKLRALRDKQQLTLSGSYRMQ